MLRTEVEAVLREVASLLMDGDADDVREEPFQSVEVLLSEGQFGGSDVRTPLVVLP